MEQKILQNKTTSAEKQGGKHILFQLRESIYGIHILKTVAVIALRKIKPIPQSPKFIKGNINLGDKTITVLDLGLIFGMDEKEYDDKTCIVIINTTISKKRKEIGIIVDTAYEVFDIPSSKIDTFPKYGPAGEEDYLQGVGRVKGKIVKLLNIEKVLSSKAIINAQKCVEE